LTTASPQNTDTPDWGHHTSDDSPVFRNIQDDEEYLNKKEDHLKMVSMLMQYRTFTILKFYLKPFQKLH
jgi:hypothetical protein